MREFNLFVDAGSQLVVLGIFEGDSAHITIYIPFTYRLSFSIADHDRIEAWQVNRRDLEGSSSSSCYSVRIVRFVSRDDGDHVILLLES